MNSTLHGATAEYIEAVRDALADQPASEVEEVIDDITEHLEQVVAELGGDPTRGNLEERLGTPQHYADELRMAAGLGGPARPTRRRRASGMAMLRFVVTWLLRLGAAFGVLVSSALWMSVNGSAAVAAYAAGLAPCVLAIVLWLLAGRTADVVAALRRLPDVQRVERGVASLRARPWGAAGVDFVTALRPAWWLLRAWLATHVLLQAAGVAPEFPVESTPAGLALLVIAITASVWWGLRTTAGVPSGWPRVVAHLGNTAMALAAPIVIFHLNTDWRPDVNSYEEMTMPSTERFTHGDGSEIVNLYVYGPDGELIEGARLYDQEGRPVENVVPWNRHERHNCLEEGGWYPGGLRSNVFPRPVVVHYGPGQPRCAEPGDAAPFGSSLPDSATEPGVAEAEVDTGPDVDATVEPAPAETQDAQLNDGVPQGESGR